MKAVSEGLVRPEGMVTHALMAPMVRKGQAEKAVNQDGQKQPLLKRLLGNNAKRSLSDQPLDNDKDIVV